MKKSLVTLAILAASSAAIAQSSVTLFGVVDTWIGSSKVEVAGVGARQAKIDANGLNGSRWGMRGTEDLGGGLLAMFMLESGINPDTGTSGQGGLLFGRQAFVGLTGNFGTVSLGRQYTAYDSVHSVGNNNYDAFTFNATTGAAGAGSVGNNGLQDYSGRADNSIIYASPVFGGFSGAVGYSFGENKNVGVNAGGSATDNSSYRVQFANGPVYVGYAFQQEKQPAAVGVAQDKRKYHVLSATYDLGVAKLNGFYNTAKSNVFSDKEYNVGVVVPFGAAALSAGYARSKTESGGISNTGKGFSVVGSYDLSKRTRVYIAALSQTSHPLNVAAETKTTIYGAGIRHSF
ncbi:MAG: porin [Candidatus Saccharibacteria bacterium]|nr:porin [Rhodoferax sp.]